MSNVPLNPSTRTFFDVSTRRQIIDIGGLNLFVLDSAKLEARDPIHRTIQRKAKRSYETAVDILAESEPIFDVVEPTACSTYVESLRLRHRQKKKLHRGARRATEVGGAVEFAV
jgi:hypothetical protein